MGKRVGRRRHNKVVVGSIIVLGILAVTCMFVRIGFMYLIFQELKEVQPVQIVVDESAEVKEVSRETVKITSTPTMEKVSRGSSKRVTLMAKDSSLLTPSNITPNLLENCLPDELKPYSGVFLQAEEQTGINAIVLTSIACLESGWGKSELSRSHNNLFGWTDSKSPSGFKYFESKEDGIMYVSERLKANYLTEEGRYFNGWNLRAVNQKYCTMEDWTDKVYSIILQLQERATRTDSIGK